MRKKKMLYKIITIKTTFLRIYFEKLKCLSDLKSLLSHFSISGTGIMTLLYCPKAIQSSTYFTQSK